MDGEIDSSSMSCLIELAVMHDEYLTKQMAANAWRRISLRLFHGLRRNSKSGSARNIAYHYDLGNDFYSSWLDSTMTYSSAVYDRDSDDLGTAQRNKYRNLADLADISLATMFWKSAAGGAVSRSTPSRNAARASLASPFPRNSTISLASGWPMPGSLTGPVKLIDYRDLEGRFDKIVSIEMFEAVGQAYWGTYFEAISSLLKDGGRAALQAITIEDDAFDEYVRDPDFISGTFSPAACCHRCRGSSARSRMPG